jgi:hypothetical protein
MSERPKQTFLAEIAQEELQKKGQLFVFWTGIFWSPDSRDLLTASPGQQRVGRNGPKDHHGR